MLLLLSGMSTIHEPAKFTGIIEQVTATVCTPLCDAAVAFHDEQDTGACKMCWNHCETAV